MQDIHSMRSGAGRIFGGDQRPCSLPNPALKCPRCDSLNTKFCYYNNYNLSQPRHFCKNCKRYWTKGGVLRRVPVGGGRRKNKRSKPNSSSHVQKKGKSTSHSSSQSLSLQAEAASSSSAAALLSFPDSSHDFEPSMMDTLDHASDGGIFLEPGSFTSSMTALNPVIPGYNLTDISPFRLHQQQQIPQQQQVQKMMGMVSDGLKVQELTSGFLDQMVPDELLGFQNRTSEGGLTALELHGSIDQGLFDQGCWSLNHWTANDPTLYLP